MPLKAEKSGIKPVLANCPWQKELSVDALALLR
jgi:hypothetical protein